MKKTLYIYLLKEQCTPVLICLAGAVFVLVTGQFLKLMRILFTSSCSLKDVVQLILFAMPNLILYASPMACLLGVLLAFVRLNGDNELIALRAAGTGFLGFLPPVLGVLTLITALSFVNAVWLLPASNRAFDGKLRSLGRVSIPSLLEEGVFISDIPKLVFFFRSVDHTNDEIKGIFVQDQREPNQEVTIVAESAKIDFPRDSGAIIFRLSDGMITRTGRDIKDAQAVLFKKYYFTLSTDEIMGAKRVIINRGEMGLAQIYRNLKTAASKASLIMWSFELEQRIAFPAACLLLGLLAPPLGSMFRQKSRMTGITIGIGIFLVSYYVLLSVGRTFGYNGLISPFLSVWMPNLMCIALAVYLWAKMHRETPFYAASLRRPLARMGRVGYRHFTEWVPLRSPISNDEKQHPKHR